MAQPMAAETRPTPTATRTRPKRIASSLPMMLAGTPARLAKVATMVADNGGGESAGCNE